MQKIEHIVPVRLVPIGNSKGIRIPKPLLQKYGYRNNLLLQETRDGLLIRSKKQKKLPWVETYQEMAKEKENWDDLQTTLADGLDAQEDL